MVRAHHDRALGRRLLNDDVARIGAIVAVEATEIAAVVSRRIIRRLAVVARSVIDVVGVSRSAERTGSGKGENA
jgi:hypothetical protein